MIGVSVGQTNIMLFRKINTWFSIKDGNWSDPETWVSNGLDKKNSLYPQPGDNVYINHNVVCDVNSTVGNIYGNGRLSFSTAITLTVNGDMQITGTVDQSGTSNTIILNGVNNSIVNYSAGVLSTFQYSSPFVQSVMPFTYNNLNLYAGVSPTSSLGVKLMTANLTITGNLALGCTLNTNNFTLSIGGTTSVGAATSTILSTGIILFTGSVNTSVGHSLTVTGAASIECRGGISGSNGTVDFSASNVNFTTNNQSILANVANVNVNNVTITGAITVTVATGGSAPFNILGVANGTVAGSTLTNNAVIQVNSFATQMATGVFNYMNNAAASMNYSFNGSGTLPYNTYSSLTITGTGIKSAGGNLTINTNLVISGKLEMSTFNLTVNGATTLSSANGAITKSGTGAVIFVGSVSTQTGSNLSAFSGNPTVEIRGGLNFQNGTMDFGTGALSFTTNNQNLTSGGGNNITFNGNVTIAAGITVTKISDGASVTFNGTLNGASSTANFTNKGIVSYMNATAPMTTGQLYCNQAVNTWTYGLAGNQDITVPSDATPGYQNLTLNGSGAKRLLGNVSVKATYTLTPPATLNSNGFALTNP